MRTIRFLFVLLCSVGFGGPAAGAELTSSDLEAWLDGFVPYALASADVAGGVVVVVKGGQTLLQKGYGYADVAERRPVDPESTVFRAGSVGKLFTETAVMQLVERGKLDLDADIGRYLDFRVPEAFGKAPNLQNLITHTGGFEERTRGLMTADPRSFVPLGPYVKGLKPTRIFPPGEIPSYCNYCLAVAGYIVQRVSGETFDDYLDRHIFVPLGMAHTTFRQPLPRALQADMSKGYEMASGPARYFELVGPAPAGSISTTGADMARFMIAHLSAQQGGAPALLRPQTARLMHTRMLRAAPPTNGMAIGFFERSRNGRRIIGHGGDSQFFHSDLLLFLDDGVGLFMSFNSTGREGAVGRIRTALFEDFTDRYFPQPLPDEPTAPTAIEHARQVAGMYASSRRAETTFFAAIGFLGQTPVEMNADGTLIVPALTGLSGKPKVWREVGPYVWREVGGRERLAARVENGRVRLLGFDSAGGIEVLLPVPGWQSSVWIKPALGAALCVLVLTVGMWPICTAIRRRFRAPLTITGQRLLGYRGVRIAALLSLLFIAGWAVLIQMALSDLANLDGQLQPAFVVMNGLGLFCVVAAAVAVWNAWLTYRSGSPWYGRIWNLALALSCVMVAWFGIAFHLTRFSVTY